VGLAVGALASASTAASCSRGARQGLAVLVLTLAFLASVGLAPVAQAAPIWVAPVDFAAGNQGVFESRVALEAARQRGCGLGRLERRLRGDPCGGG